ncbi:hypothetical protein FTV88_0373 [Heliorestis convoluta]|uniref:Uncharacterized protein n=1 Tax=Heliorestis convoluta TaxID=356322 RepID=A0A5Q2N015_9FIRM|nr:hypothetical protein FTV88_0373 [Heliorestis convoluta]
MYQRKGTYTRAAIGQSVRYCQFMQLEQAGSSVVKKGPKPICLGPYN